MADTAQRVHVVDLPNEGDEAWHVLIEGAVDVVSEPNYRVRYMELYEARQVTANIMGAGVAPDYWALTFGPVPGTYRTRRRRRFRRRPRSAERWESLSPAYRRRLQRAGITRYRYLRGDSLAPARGHRPPPPVATPQARALATADPGLLGQAFPRAEWWIFVRTLEGH